jgi:hypothetical protein
MQSVHGHPYTRLPGVWRPYDVLAGVATLLITLGFRFAFKATGIASPGFAAPSGFLDPSTLHSTSCPFGLVSCRCHPWASVPFEGFSPTVAPGASRLAASSLSLPRLRVAGFEDFSVGWVRGAASHG